MNISSKFKGGFYFIKLKNFLRFSYLFLLLSFCVAVSGGCGGSSGGHYSSNYAVSSQDVAPDTDDITSDDDYGGNEYRVYHSFTQLNNTEWTISNVAVYVADTNEALTVVPDSYNYNATKLKLQVLGDNALLWYDGDEFPHGNWISPLTVNVVKNLDLFTAPILRSGIFEEYLDSAQICRYEAIVGEKNSELISVYFTYRMSSILVKNVFVVNEIEYTSEMTLLPYSD